MRLPHARNFRRKGLVTRLVLVQLGLVFMDTNSCILFLFGNDIQQTKLCFKTDAPLPCYGLGCAPVNCSAVSSPEKYSPYAASNWCFVKHSPVHKSGQLEEVILVLVAGKIWEILSYIVTIYVYVHIA